jgi:Fur family transcriptional regulator, zinc uptake regulator|tara:strand:+ start:64 stop:429 length:366 start_codon:yes stop_codon:yes gene_type:complete
MNNKELVFSVIKKSTKNLTAYEILDKLQKIKKTQPMTVYRALDSLIEEERIHKFNQTKTFMLCNHSHSKNHSTAVAICKNCGDTEELKSNLFEMLFKKSNIKKYDFNSFNMEVLTTCKGCN